MQSKIEQQVMASVATIYTVRKLVSASALKLYACMAALWGVGQLVWVSRVFENLGRVGLENSGHFMLSALLNTDFYVQAAVLVLVVAGFSLMRDLVRLSPQRTTFA